MSLVLEDSVELTNLGDAIRSKTGGSEPLTILEMATAVNSISGGSSKQWVSVKIPRTVNSYYKKYTYDLSNYVEPGDTDFVLLFFSPESNNSSTYYRQIWSPMFPIWLNVGGYGNSYSNYYYLNNLNFYNYSSTIEDSSNPEARIGSFQTQFKPNGNGSSTTWITTTYDSTAQIVTFSTTMSNASHLVSPNAILMYKQ